MFSDIAAAVCAATASVSLDVVIPHLTWIGPSRCHEPLSVVKLARWDTVSTRTVSSSPPAYPPNNGICSTIIVLLFSIQEAIMLSAASSILISFSCETSWLSHCLIPLNVSAAARPAADSGVSGPYMPISGRPALIQASLTLLNSNSVPFISQGLPDGVSSPRTLFGTPSTIVSTLGSWA